MTKPRSNKSDAPVLFAGLVVLVGVFAYILYSPSGAGDPDYQSTLTAKAEKGGIGTDLVIENWSDTDYVDCRISVNGGKFKLPRPTVLDATESRAYPLQLFRSDAGRSPLTVSNILIHCRNPSFTASFG